jgi:hypothetical protein
MKLNYGIIDNAVEDIFIINSLYVQKSNKTVESFPHNVKKKLIGIFTHNDISADL